MTKKAVKIYRQILVPLDGSAVAEQVLPYVQALARPLRSQIDLLRVIEPVPPEMADVAHGDYPHRVSASVSSHAQDYLEHVARPLRAQGLQVNALVQEGSAAAAIIAAADGPDTLIAMCTHGRSGVTRWAVGSVTDKVLHGTSNSMLVVRAGDGVTAVDLETLIVPLDGSALAEQALRPAVALAHDLGLRMILLRITPSAEEYHRYMAATPVSAAARVYSGPYEEFAKEADAQAMGYLHGISDRLGEARPIPLEEMLRRGHPAEIISEVAEATPRSLILMTTHGRSGVGRWILGSVTDRVVRQSGHPVLVIHPHD